jgi:CRP-like cAMP-binding protein
VRGGHRGHLGERGDSLFIIQSGSVEIYVNDYEGERLVLHPDER